MLQKLDDLHEEVTVGKIDRIVLRYGGSLEVGRVLEQYLQYRVAVIKIIVQ